MPAPPTQAPIPSPIPAMLSPSAFPKTLVSTLDNMLPAVFIFLKNFSILIIPLAIAPTVKIAPTTINAALIFSILVYPSLSFQVTSPVSSSTSFVKPSHSIILSLMSRALLSTPSSCDLYSPRADNKRLSTPPLIPPDVPVSPVPLSLVSCDSILSSSMPVVAFFSFSADFAALSSPVAASSASSPSSISNVP